MSPEDRRAALVREAIRLHQRYQRELVERFSVCPWAKLARLEGRTRTHVVVEPLAEVAALKPLVDGWADDEHTEVAFIIMPRFDRGAAAFSDVAEACGALRADVFLSAAFYASAGPTGSTVHFLRQSPDPTVQLVRRSRLEAIRAADPPHYTDIFQLSLRELEAGKPARTVAASVLAHNEHLLEREGRSTLQSIIEDIRADRERTYAQLLARGDARSSLRTLVRKGPE